MRLSGKTAVVTGAGSGFGEGIAKTFAREGACVVVNDLNAAAAERVAGDIVRPRPGLVWYNSTKGAMITASKTLAVELGADRIRVNCVNPVLGETGLTSEFMGVPDTPENRARFVATIPLGRLSTPQDIANAALYLASDEAAFVTGICVEVDGGRCV